jgi:hypothetical protein
MDKTKILNYVEELKKKYDVKLYVPYKYVDGLKTKQEISSRFLDIMNNKTYYKTDFKNKKYKETKLSKYTIAFQQYYGPQYKSLKQKSKVTGVPLYILEKIYDKGLAAWKTGHRVGANPSQWAYARVHSFLTLGCTVFSSDFKLFKEALEKMSLTFKKKLLSQKIHCPKATLNSEYYKKKISNYNYIINEIKKMKIKNV